MKKIENFPRLYERGGRYVYRAVVPAHLRETIGYTEFKRTLGTDSLKVAKRAWAEIDAEFERIKSAAQRAVGSAPSDDQKKPPLQSMSMTDMEALVCDWHAYRRNSEFEILGKLSRADRTAKGRFKKVRNDKKLYADVRHWGLRHTAVEVMEYLCKKHNFEMPENGSHIWNRFADRIMEARADISKHVLARMDDDFSESPPEADPSFLKRAQVQQTLHSGSNHVAVPLGDAVEAYVTDPTRNAKDSTRRANRDKLSPLVRHFGADADLKDITSEDFEAWTRLLLRLPKNAGKRFPAGSLEEMVKAGEAVGAEPIARSNARGIQQSASSLIDHLVKRERLDRNRLKPHILPKTKFTKPTRRPFTVAELNTLFRQPVFTGCIDEERGFAKTGPNVPKRSRYWLPLIALFTGMRMGEIAQLWTDDVSEQDGVWALRVQFNADRDQELKNPGSDRIIPIHKTLIELGFVDWASAARQKKATRLFPDIPKSKDKQDFSSIFSKRFSKFLETADLWRDGRTFHSLRHNFRDAVRDADLSDGVAKVLGGWADDEPHNQYGRGYKIEKLKTAIDKLDFVEGEQSLDLSHLIPKQ